MMFPSDIFILLFHLFFCVSHGAHCSQEAKYRGENMLNEKVIGVFDVISKLPWIKSMDNTYAISRLDYDTYMRIEEISVIVGADPTSGDDILDNFFKDIFMKTMSKHVDSPIRCMGDIYNNTDAEEVLPDDHMVYEYPKEGIFNVVSTIHKMGYTYIEVYWSYGNPLIICGSPEVGTDHVIAMVAPVAHFR